MVRLEIVAPVSKVDSIIRQFGNIGVTHFINIAEVKAEKYKGLAKKIGKTPREENLLQLSNRVYNLMRKLEEIPYPEPIKIKEDIDEILKEIEREIGTLELEYAKLENLMKNIAEERATFEREVSQFNEEYETVRKLLSEFKVPPDKIYGLSFEEFSKREKIRECYDRAMTIQKTLISADMAAKLTSPYEKIPQTEEELNALKEKVEANLKTHRQIKGEIAQAANQIAKIEEILNSVMEVLDRKLEAVDKLKKAINEASKLKSELQEIRSYLGDKILSLVGREFEESLTETIKVLEMVARVKFASPEVEEAARKLSKSAYGILRGYEILEAAERFLRLQNVKSLIEEVSKGKTEEIEKLFRTSKELVETVPTAYMTMLERALRIVHLENKIRALAEEPVKIKRMITELASKSSQIHAYRELLDIELRLEELKKKFMKTGRTTVFEAWVPKEKMGTAVKTVQKVCPEAVVNPAGEEKGDRPPTLMVNPPFAKCFEKLVAAFGLPNYHEIDPTIITVVTFPIIFGLMFGDMGHGLILLIGGFLIKPIFDKYKIKGEMWDALYQGRNLIIACGISATIIGFLYGEFFGPTSAIHPDTPNWYTMITGLEHAPWFSPSEAPHGVLKLLKIAIIVGIAQITFGIVLDLINKVSAREFREALAPASWLWFYGSLSYLILTYKLNIGKVLLEPNTLTMFFIVPFAFMFVAHKLAGKSGIDLLAESIEKAIASISNTASYGRILALGMTHILFSELALMGSGLMFWPIMIVCTLFLVIALEGILTFAHTLRLHWVEWFSKFYVGDGSAFEGFRIERKFTIPAA
jgi:V/A-type H+-transporting ATPase subunit I